MFKTFRSLALTGAFSLAATVASAQDIVFSGVSTTSDDYQLGVVWSGIARDVGISMTVIENGTVSGMRKAAQGEIDIVGVGAPHFLNALGGTGKYVDDPEALREGYKGMKAILAMPVGMAQYVARTDTGITSFKDFEGKTVGTGRPGGNAGKVTATLFDIHGIGGKVDGQAIKYGPAMEQMASGTMDATLVWGSLPNAVIDNASRQMELRFVSPDPETLEKFRSTISNGEYYVYQKIPAASIEKASEGRVEAEADAYFWTFPYQVMVRGEIVEDRVRERVTIVQSKTNRPVQFEVSENTRETIVAWLDQSEMLGCRYLFPGRFHASPHISTRQYARLVRDWVSAIGLEPSGYGTYS